MYGITQRIRAKDSYPPGADGFIDPAPRYF